MEVQSRFPTSVDVQAGFPTSTCITREKYAPTKAVGN